MTQINACEPWYDNTWWEVKVPEDWSFARTKTIKNWPYILRSPNYSELTIWTSKHVIVYGPAPNPTYPIALNNEDEIKAYKLAELPPEYGVATQLNKRRLGNLVGFTRNSMESSIGWVGFFISEPWMIQANFEPISEPFEEDESVAYAILASLQFYP